MTPQKHIAELEDALKEKERRIVELKADLDKEKDLTQRQDEHLRSCDEIIEAWKEAFDMKLNADGVWVWSEAVIASEGLHDKYNELVSEWNHFVPIFNAKVRLRNVGRPLGATDAERQTILKLRSAGMSLRGIAEETGRGLNTVRTIIDQRDQRDRTSIKYLERIRRSKDEAAEKRTWQSRKRTRHGLPRRIDAFQRHSAELRKEAKGLK